MADNITTLAESTIEPLIQDYIVDFASNNNFFYVNGVQGDGHSTRYARLSLSNNGQPYIIDKEIVWVAIRGTKPDTYNIFNECQILNESTIQFELTQQMLAVAGKGNYEISIMDRKQSSVLTSFPFFVYVSPSSFNVSAVTSSNEFQLLISKINQVDEQKQEVQLVINNAELVIEDCETKTQLCVEATDSAKLATEELRALEASIKEAENARVKAENLRQENTTTAISNAEKATSDAIDATEDLRELETNVQNAEALRVGAENLRQTNTSIAISNAEKATEDAITATENANNATSDANIATEEAQKRIDEYDSLTVPTVMQNVLEAIENANTSASNADIARQNAEKATEDANEATELALDAVKQIQDALGIDDTKESSTTVWSSAHTHEVINNAINENNVVINQSIESLRGDTNIAINNSIDEAKEKYQRYRLSDITIKTTDWVDKVVYIKNDKITESSVIDIYYNNSSLLSVYDLEIIYTQGVGYLCLTATYIPTEDIIIDAIAIENYFNESSVEVSGTV